jgi:hypothetical protein
MAVHEDGNEDKLWSVRVGGRVARDGVAFEASVMLRHRSLPSHAHEDGECAAPRPLLRLNHLPPSPRVLNLLPLHELGIVPFVLDPTPRAESQLGNGAIVLPGDGCSPSSESNRDRCSEDDDEHSRPPVLLADLEPAESQAVQPFVGCASGDGAAEKGGEGGRECWSVGEEEKDEEEDEGAKEVDGRRNGEESDQLATTLQNPRAKVTDR